MRKPTSSSSPISERCAPTRSCRKEHDNQADTSSLEANGNLVDEFGKGWLNPNMSMDNGDGDVREHHYRAQESAGASTMGMLPWRAPVVTDDESRNGAMTDASAAPNPRAQIGRDPYASIFSSTDTNPNSAAAVSKRGSQSSDTDSGPRERNRVEQDEFPHEEESQFWDPDTGTWSKQHGLKGKGRGNGCRPSVSGDGTSRSGTEIVDELEISLPELSDSNEQGKRRPEVTLGVNQPTNERAKDTASTPEKISLATLAPRGAKKRDHRLH